ncbi:Proline dehydrogenase [hydrothermal vent metagenome]|uniref:proline dehydrogenase n=1 Tax=hydrothermal vent metagenome TaxID=652676 RepID=A0A3B0QZY3_9ZZZZ
MKDPVSYFAKRYIAGEIREDAVRVAGELNEKGIVATIDNLGENVRDTIEAMNGLDEYMALLREINDACVDSTISLKLTHLGLDQSQPLVIKNVSALLKKVEKYKSFIRIDMESSAYTEATIESVIEIHKDHPDIGVAIQSYLLRSAADIERLIKEGVSVRLVKGAYKEPPDLAFADKAKVDESYSTLMKELLMRGNNPAFATHDETLIAEAKAFAKDNNIPKEAFEFQMLLGVRRKAQLQLAKEGYRIRVYVPYGKEWMAYIMRRFKERKENVWFFIKNIFDR